jgi:hypothetical protein
MPATMFDQLRSLKSEPGGQDQTVAPPVDGKIVSGLIRETVFIVPTLCVHQTHALSCERSTVEEPVDSLRS